MSPANAMMSMNQDVPRETPAAPLPLEPSVKDRLVDAVIAHVTPEVIEKALSAGAFVIVGLAFAGLLCYGIKKTSGPWTSS